MYISVPGSFQALVITLLNSIDYCSFRHLFPAKPFLLTHACRFMPGLVFNFFILNTIKDESASFLQQAFNGCLPVQHQYFFQQLLFVPGCYTGPGWDRSVEACYGPLFFLGTGEKSKRNTHAHLRLAWEHGHGRSEYQKQFRIFIDHRGHAWYLESDPAGMEMLQTL